MTILVAMAYNSQKKVEVMQEPRFLSVKDIAKELGVSEDLVITWIRDKILPAYKVTKKEYRIMREDYEKFLAERRTRKDD